MQRPEAMLRHVHLSGVACALTQLRTLHRGQLRRMTGKATPWRRDPAGSVHETQLQLRTACQTRPHFTKSARARHIAKDRSSRVKP